MMQDKNDGMAGAVTQQVSQGPKKKISIEFWYKHTDKAYHLLLRMQKGQKKYRYEPGECENKEKAYSRKLKGEIELSDNPRHQSVTNTHSMFNLIKP